MGQSVTVRSMRHKLAISIAASAASQPLFPPPGPERASACSWGLPVRTPKRTGHRARALDGALRVREIEGRELARYQRADGDAGVGLDAATGLGDLERAGDAD